MVRTQDRNTSGTIFGGQLLRYGLEMAQAVAERHSGEPMRLVAMQVRPSAALS